jgi:hypothetical protein
MRSANKNRRSPPTQNNLAASSPRSNEQPTRVSAASASVASQSTTMTGITLVSVVGTFVYGKESAKAERVEKNAQLQSPRARR